MKREWQKIIFYLLSIVLFIINCQIAFGNSSAGSSMKQNDHEKYFFEMSETQQKIFFNKLKLLKHGDSIKTIKDTLGEPNYDQKLIGKKGEFIARELIYYIKMWKKNLVNEKYDKSVRLILNSEDKLIKIESDIKIK
jgi:hypothetical protein